MTIRPATASTFPAVMKAAVAGDRVTINEPFAFGLLGLSYAAPGVIVELGPAAVIVAGGGGWSSITKCTNIAFEGGACKTLIGLGSSTGITFKGVDFSGTGAKVGGGSAISMRDTDAITISGCKFHELEAGISGIRPGKLVIEDCDFRELWADGCKLQTLGDLTFARNKATLFRGPSLHLDLLQVYGADNTVPVHDVLVEGNEYTRGIGGTPAQFIFIGENLAGYRNTIIRQNRAYGPSWWGIGLAGADASCVVEDNFIQGSTEPWVGQVISPWIRADGARLANNVNPAPAADDTALRTWLKRNDIAPDPRDALIADLQAKIAAYVAAQADWERNMGVLADERDALKASLAASDAMVAAVREAVKP